MGKNFHDDDFNVVDFLTDVMRSYDAEAKQEYKKEVGMTDKDREQMRQYAALVNEAVEIFVDEGLSQGMAESLVKSFLKING